MITGNISRSPGGSEDAAPELKSIRFPQGQRDTLPVVTEFAGATLTVLSVHADWRGRSVAELNTRPLGQRRIPTSQEQQESLFVSNEEMHAIRSGAQYGCHDLRIVRHTHNGELEYLATRRVEPSWKANLAIPLTDSDQPKERLHHTAPINGCWWPPGGRVVVPKPGSPLERTGFDSTDSVLLKLFRETGILPTAVQGMYFLGVGETSFPCKMEYTYRGLTQDGGSYLFRVPIEMPLPQTTLNKNYVIEIAPDTPIKLTTLTNGEWITGATYRKHRDQFCDYEQAFLDALFAESVA